MLLLPCVVVLSVVASLTKKARLFKKKHAGLVIRILIIFKS